MEVTETASKKRRLPQPKEENTTTCLHSIACDIRLQVCKWQRRASVDQKLKCMKEKKEFEVKVKRSGAAFAASIYCNMCMKSIALGTKSGKPLISNWTRHVAKCIKSPKDKTFFPTASTST